MPISRHSEAEAGDLRSLWDDALRIEHLSEILKALGHPIRLRIVALLACERQHVTGLAERLGLPQPIISQHLRILRMRRLVTVEREEGFAVYRILEPRLRRLVRCMEET